MFAENTYIESATLEPDYYNLNLKGKGAMLLCGQLLKMFRDSGGKNYHTSTFRMEFGDPASMDQFALTIQKLNGDDSPAETISCLRSIIKKLEISRPRGQLEAYAQFLFDERARHEEDIAAIDRKLAVLAKRGIEPTHRGDWITEREIDGCEIYE